MLVILRNMVLSGLSKTNKLVILRTMVLSGLSKDRLHTLAQAQSANHFHHH